MCIRDRGYVADFKRDADNRLVFLGSLDFPLKRKGVQLLKPVSYTHLKDLGSTKSILFWLPQVSLSFLQSVCFGGKSSACINNMINAVSTYLPISACTPDQFHSKAFSWDYSYVTKNGLPYGRFSIFTFFSSSQNSFLFISVSNQKTILNMSRSVLRPSRFSQVISVASPL